MDGLNQDQVIYRKNNGLSNNVEVKYSRTTKQIILSNTITLFNILNVVLLILVLTTGSIQNALFMGSIIFNTLIAIFQEIKAKSILDSLTIFNQTKVKVKRDGKIEEIDKNELVLDDLMFLSSGDDVVVDAVIEKASMCEVDEAVITGESDSVIKKKGDKLISGSVIIAGNCYAKVVSVGGDNYASNLVKEASTIKDNSSYLMNSINKILKIVTFLIVPTGVLLFITQYYHSHQTYSEAILSTVAGVIGMIPEGLVLLTSIALTVGVIKMSKRNVIIQKLSGIEMLSCVDVLCLDKTGTITDGTMEVVDIVKLDDKYDIEEIIGNMIIDESNNATDIALKKKFEKKDTMKIKERVPFSSSRKCSKIICDKEIFALGALEYINGEKISKYDNYLLKYIEQGYRIISLVSSKDEEFKKSDVIGFIIIKDNIRKNAKETLRYFKKQDVKIKVISGDNPATVSSILKQLEFDDYDKYISGNDLPKNYVDLKEIVNKYTIYGRVTPYQKQQLIRALKENNTVGMIGDGVNDILALKEADCGIALASGISAARSVSEVVLTDSDFSVLPEIVNEGRRVVNNIERVASMYLIKTIYSFILSVLSIVISHEYPFYPVQLSLISSICVGIPSFFLALEPNYTKVKKGFIVKVFRNALPSGLVVFANIFFIIMFCSIFNRDFENYRIIIVTVTGLITLRLLYNICKPLNVPRKILLVLCTVPFFLALILYPDIFLVTKYNFLNILFIVLLSFCDLYVIEFFEGIYDKLVLKKDNKGVVYEKKEC